MQRFNRSREAATRLARLFIEARSMAEGQFFDCDNPNSWEIGTFLIALPLPPTYQGMKVVRVQVEPDSGSDLAVWIEF